MTELQQLLADSARELFEAEVTPELLEAADRGEWPAALWRVLDDAEYPRLFASGEADVTWADAHPVVEAAGAALAPVPLPEAVLASWLAASAGIALPPGIVTVVPQRADEPWSAERRGGAWSITGAAAGVPWAAAAQGALVVVNAGTEPLLALLPTRELHLTVGRNAAGEPRDAVAARDLAADAAPLGALPADIVRRFGALVRAAQIAGAIRRIVRLTAAYAGERRQFGRRIADFQAISQQLAVLAEESVAASTAAAYAWHEASADPATPATAVAKIRTGQAAGIAAGIAHAVFGAIGITAEHSLHFATRRLWSWRAEFGAEREWAHELGATIVRDGGSGLWRRTTD